jgi:multiple sugar transport system substrate-binding protein
MLILLITPVLSVLSFSSPSNESREQVTLVAILEDQGDPKRWDTLIQPALDELKMRHPELNIQINYTAYPYDRAKSQMINEIPNQIHADLVNDNNSWLLVSTFP